MGNDYWDGEEGEMAESAEAPPGMLAPSDALTVRYEVSTAWANVIGCVLQIALGIIVIGGLVLFVLFANQSNCVVPYLGPTGCARLEWTDSGLKEIQPWKTPIIVTPTHR